MTDKEVSKKVSKEAKDEPNPWLKIDHEHDRLPANNGRELVCGLCSKRIKNN